MIIGLAGVKQSGKNTAAKFIAEDFGEEFQVKEWSFAAKLKQSAMAAITGNVMSVEEAVRHCDELKEVGEFRLVGPDLLGHPEIDPEGHQFSGREFLQWYGTEAHREIFGDDFWIKAVMDNLPNPVYENGHSYEWNSRLDLITDVRFPNEAEAITDAGGKVIKITRPSVENTGDTHASEKPLPDDLCWANLINDTSLGVLQTILHVHTLYAISQMYIGEYDLNDKLNPNLEIANG